MTSNANMYKAGIYGNVLKRNFRFNKNCLYLIVFLNYWGIYKIADSLLV